MLLEDFIRSATKPLGDAYRFHILESWGNFGIRIFKKMSGGTKEYQIKVGSDVFRVYVNKSTDVDAPDMDTFKMIPQANLQYGFVTKDGAKDCGTLIINTESKMAYISIVYGEQGCIATESGDLADRIGTKMVEVMIEWCRLRGIKKMYLEDRSQFYCNKSPFLPVVNLSKAYTLTHGHPWYFNFGFKFNNKSYNKNVQQNKDLYNNLKTKDVTRLELLHLIKTKMKDNKVGNSHDFEAIKQLYEDHKDNLFGEFAKALQKNYCEVFAWIYNNLFDAIGYKSLSGFLMVKEL
jgi:hypothetical protein